MLTIAIVAATAAFATQLAKRYLTWARTNPKTVVLIVTAIGASVAFRYVGANWLWTFGLSTLAAVGVYEFLIKRP